MFLSNRRQVTKIGNIFIVPKFIIDGVPQLSHLGPLLFLLDVNDLPIISNLFSPILFANETTIIFKGDYVDYVTTVCNSELVNIFHRTTCNGLYLNCNKTFSMSFALGRLCLRCK